MRESHGRVCGFLAHESAAAMTHRGLHRAVEAWVDGELGDVRAGLVRDHLGQCAGCSSHAALLRSV